MKYLSDLLYVDVPTDSFIGENRIYTVSMKYIKLKWDATTQPPVSPLFSEDTIYTGNIYGTGDTVRVYLNDIVETYTYDNSYVYSHLYNTAEFIHTGLDKGILFEISVYVDTIGTFSASVGDELIMNYYRDSKTGINRTIPVLYSSAEQSYNLLNQRTDVLPRIPNLPYATDKFWFSTIVASTIGWLTPNIDSGAGQISLVKSRNFIANSAYAVSTHTTSPINAMTIKGETYKNITDNADSLLFAGVYNSYNTNFAIPVATIDECPAEYYLIWIDRTGAYQCQPFNGKNVLSEDVTTEYKVNLIGENNVSRKTITNKWSLNSGWLSEEQYKAYESIFASNYIYLYNTVYDEGHKVTLETTSWSEKTKKNRDKLYNLSISVKSALAQNIAY